MIILLTMSDSFGKITYFAVNDNSYIQITVITVLLHRIMLHSIVIDHISAILSNL